MFNTDFTWIIQQFKSGSYLPRTDCYENSLTYYGQQSIYGADIPLSACGIVMKVNGIMISIFVR